MLSVSFYVKITIRENVNKEGESTNIDETKKIIWDKKISKAMNQLKISTKQNIQETKNKKTKPNKTEAEVKLNRAAPCPNQHSLLVS